MTILFRLLHLLTILSTTDIGIVFTDSTLTYCLFVLRFYGEVNPMGSGRARSDYLTTRLLGMLSPLSG